MTMTTTKEDPMTDSGPGSDGQHDSRDAHVQVLTAEVRTLVVGSRQVTMSVYNQLDEVRYCHIEPFGRVAPRDALNGWVYVVGKDGATGALARSSLPYADWGVTENRKAFKNQLWRAIPGDAQYSLEYARRAEATAYDYANVVRLLLLANAARAYRHQSRMPAGSPRVTSGASVPSSSGAVSSPSSPNWRKSPIRGLNCP